MQIVWTKAGHGIWGLGPVFEGTSPQMSLMTVLSQGIGSLNPFQNLKPSLLQSVPERASMCSCSRWGTRLERASIPQLLMPLTGSEDLQNMLKFACT